MGDAEDEVEFTANSIIYHNNSFNFGRMFTCKIY